MLTTPTKFKGHQSPSIPQVSDDLQRLIRIATDMHDAGRLDTAAAVWRSVLRLAPRHDAALQCLGLLHRSTGNFTEAAVLLRRAVAIRSHDPQLMFQLASTVHHLGCSEQAIADYDLAIALDPNSAEAHCNRGALLTDLAHLGEALESYDRALTIRPNFPEAHCNRGVTLERLFDHEAALLSYDMAIAIAPHFMAAHLCRASVLRTLSRFSEALESFDRVIALQPNHAVGHSGRGATLGALGRHAEALASCDYALSVNPDDAETFCNRGVTLEHLGRYEEALASYDRAIISQPHNAGFHRNRGFLLRTIMRFDEALVSYDKAIEINPFYVEAHNNRGFVMRVLNRYQDALSSYDRAIMLRPDDAEAHANRGVALSDLNVHDEALLSFDRAIALNPSYAEAYCNKSFVALALGDYSRGWALYEWRKRVDKPADVRRLPYPEALDREAMTGKRVLIHCEQGLGDTLHFCRYIPMVVAISRSVTFLVPPALYRIIATSFVDVQVISENVDSVICDVHCPLMSLPFVFSTTIATIPAGGPYLFAQNATSAAFAAMLGPHTRPRVGLVWNGGFRPGQPELHTVNQRRNIEFSMISDINIDGLDFFSLQKGEPAEGEVEYNVRKFWKGENFFNVTSSLEDFLDTAGLIENLDLVISVDTSTAHLAGAMGKPVWILNRFDACWRWLVNRTDSPWYPTATLFQQPTPGAWQPVIRSIRAELIKHFHL